MLCLNMAIGHVVKIYTILNNIELKKLWFYAEAVRSYNGSDEPQTGSTTDSLLTEIKGMMAMMREMMGQITVMTNLLITLIPKATPRP